MNIRKILSNRIFKICTGIFFSVLFIIIIIRSVDFIKVLDEIKKFDLRLLWVLIGIYFFGMVIRTLRWQIIIKQVKYLNFSPIFKALVYGFMINNVLPAKVGEIARAEYLARKYHTSRSFLLGTVVTERLFDVFIVLMFFVLSMVFSVTIRNVFYNNIWLLIIIVAGLMLAIIFMLNKYLRDIILIIIPIKFREQIRIVLDKFSKSIGFVRNGKQLMYILLLSVIIWFGTYLSCYVILTGLNVKLPFNAYLFIVSAASLGMVIPSTSANIGVYHAVAMSVVMLWSVNKETALSYAIISHAFDFFPNVILGLLLFFKRIVFKNKELL